MTPGLELMEVGLHRDCSAFVAEGRMSRDEENARKVTFWSMVVSMGHW